MFPEDTIICNHKHLLNPYFVSDSYDLIQSSKQAKELGGSVLLFYRGQEIVSERLNSCPKLHSCFGIWESPRSGQLQSPGSKAHAVNAKVPQIPKTPNRPKCPAWASAELLQGRPSWAAQAQLFRANAPEWLEHGGQSRTDHGVSIGLARRECYSKDLGPGLEDSGSQHSVCITVTKVTVKKCRFLASP